MFSFLRKKTFLKEAVFASVILLLLAGLLCISCKQPTDDPPPPPPPGKPLGSMADFAKIGVDADFPLDGTYYLSADLNLNWMPIGDKDNPFTGVFDGNGKTITLTAFHADALTDKTYLGIFGYVEGTASQKAEIKNFKLVSSVGDTSTATAGQAIGLVAGGAEHATIEDITLSGSFGFESGKTIYVGGVAGYIQAGTLIKNCSSSLTMNIIPGSGSQIYTTNASHNPNYIGGFVGMFEGGAGIENCRNTGNVTADSTISSTRSGQVKVGGVAGGSYYYAFAPVDVSYKGYIKNSSSTGTILGKGEGYNTEVGGIAGTTGGDGTKIENCYATGTVSSAGTKSGSPYIGGIVGYNYYGAVVSQCYFNGTVIADKSGDNTGGIAGYNSQTTGANSIIEDCWSTGTVTGYRNAGGIVGENQVNTYIRRCYSIAIVSATDNVDAAANASNNYRNAGVGGIAGFNASANTDALTACVALNPSITASTGNNIYRITGAGTGNRSANHAWSGMTVTTGGTYTADKGATAPDGEDCVQKPALSFYTGLGWDFTTVWKMGSDGYPKLAWQ